MNDLLADVLLDPDEILAIDPRDELLGEINEMTSEVAEVKQSVIDLKQIGDPVSNGVIFSDMTDLISRATAVLDSCKDDIERSSILDAELISAYSSLIKSTRDITSDYLDIYRDRQKHLDKLELEDKKQEHRKEIIIMKDNLDKSVEGDRGETKAFVQEAVVEILNNRDKTD